MSNKPKYRLKDGAEKQATKNAASEQPVYKTEEMLKQEARERLADQQKLEAAKPPMSVRKKKLDNYFYHYKWHTIIACVGAFMLFFLLRDTLFRPKPDLTLIVATSRYIMQSETDAVQAALANYAGDINGDGRVLVNMDTINVPITSMLEEINNGDGPQEMEDYIDMGSGADPEMLQASIMKLMAIVAAGSDQLFLLDDELYDYLTAMAGPSPESGDGTNGSSSGAGGENVAGGGESGDGGAESPSQADVWLSEYSIFEPLGLAESFGLCDDRLAIKDTVLADEPGFEYLGELAFSLRPPPNNSQKNLDYYTACMQLLKAISEAEAG